jgi:hypothetical protein
MGETFDLTQEALLVRLYIGQGGLTSRSSTLTREAAEAHQADYRSVAGVIYILTAEDRKETTKAINEARAFFYANTLPWDDNAYRLVPVTRYAHLKRELQRIENEFSDSVERLLANYDHLRKDYLRRVNDLAQEVPFPTSEEFRAAFKFDLLEMPIASPHDIRLRHVNQTTVNELRTKVTAQMNDRLASAQAEIVERLKDRVRRLKEQTADKDSRLFKSLVSNIEEDVDVLPKLNLTNDPEINRLIERVRAELAGIDVTTLRGDSKEAQKLRGHIHKTASSVLDDLQSYGKTRVVAVHKAKAEPKTEADKEPVAAATGKGKGKGFDFGKFAEFRN